MVLSICSEHTLLLLEGLLFQQMIIDHFACPPEQLRLKIINKLLLHGDVFRSLRRVGEFKSSKNVSRAAIASEGDCNLFLFIQKPGGRPSVDSWVELTRFFWGEIFRETLNTLCSDCH